MTKQEELKNRIAYLKALTRTGSHAFDKSLFETIAELEEELRNLGGQQLLTE